MNIAMFHCEFVASCHWDSYLVDLCRIHGLEFACLPCRWSSSNFIRFIVFCFWSGLLVFQAVRQSPADLTIPCTNLQLDGFIGGIPGGNGENMFGCKSLFSACAFMHVCLECSGIFYCLKGLFLFFCGYVWIAYLGCG